MPPNIVLTTTAISPAYPGREYLPKLFLSGIQGCQPSFELMDSGEPQFINPTGTLPDHFDWRAAALY